MDNIIIQGEGPPTLPAVYKIFYYIWLKGGDLYYGLLQAFADALKLLLKEYVSPTQANLGLFFSGPIITLIFSLLGYLVVPQGLQGNIVKLRGGPKAYFTKL